MYVLLNRIGRRHFFVDGERSATDSDLDPMGRIGVCRFDPWPRRLRLWN
jgi:hypothetical protein